MDRLVIIDGNSLLFKGYFAMRPMITKDGVYTQGVYAFINMLTKILNDYEPTHVAVAFDMPSKTFRHEFYPEYKAGRQKTPPELLSQIPLLHEVLSAMNIKVMEKERYEADDIIGTVTARADAAGMESFVISGDRDELQLVSENTKVVISKKGVTDFTVYDLDEMQARYSLTPLQFIDLKGLMGDKSDNIPGLPGVGEKKGISLLTQYGTLENVIDHGDEIKGKLGETVRTHASDALLSKQLATINREVPYDFSLDELKRTKPDYTKLVEVYKRLEFRSFLNKLQQSEGASGAVSDSEENFEDTLLNIETVTYSEFLKLVPSGSIVYIDLGTDASHLCLPEIRYLAMYSENKNLYTFMLVTNLDAYFVLAEVASLYTFSGVGLKDIAYTFFAYGVTEISLCDDVEIAEYLINPNASRYAIDKMLLKYEGVLFNGKSGESENSGEQISIEEISDDTADDNVFEKRKLFAVSRVVAGQATELKKLGLETLYWDIEMPLVIVLADMEIRGIKVNRKELDSINVAITEKISELEAAIYDLAGTEFNINSPKQLGKILFEDLEIPYPAHLAKGKNYSTAADILECLKDDYPIASYVLEYRKYTKLKGTYCEGLSVLIADDGKIHPHFMQTVAATGRLSCTEPNLQNIPIRTEEGRMIRKAFVAEEGCVFVGADYSQIELRIMASLSGDESLINSFLNGEDIHKATAARVFGLDPDEVTSLDRSRAKAINFGVIYGMSGFGLGNELDISRAEGQQYINQYFEKHHAVKDFLDEQVRIGENERMVRTLFGRIRQIPDFSSRKYAEREAAKRVAMNTPVQGTAADIIKIAMNKVYESLKSLNVGAGIVLQIHDELIIETPAEYADEVRELLKNCMETACEMAVPLLVEVNSADNWYDLK